MIKRNGESLPRAARIVLVVILVCSLMAAFPAARVKAVTTNLIIVGPNGHFPTLMAALRNAGPNTVIKMKSGTYIGDYESNYMIDLSQMGVIDNVGAGDLTILSEEGVGKAIINSRLVNSSTFPGRLWIEGVSFQSTYDSAITLTDVPGVILSNCIIKSGGVGKAAISLTVNNGVTTFVLNGTVLNNFMQDGLDVQVTGAGKANVLVESSTFKADSPSFSPQKGIDVTASGWAQAQLTVYNSVFSGLQDAAVSVNGISPAPVVLTTHISNSTLMNVAQTAGKNAVEVRSLGGGDHVVTTRVISNTISMPTSSDGIELIPTSGKDFRALITDNSIILGTGTPGGTSRGVVIDNGAGGTAAKLGSYKIFDNTIKNTAKSGVAITLQNATAAWYGSIQTNGLVDVNTTAPGTNEGMLFRVVKSGAFAPVYKMLITGNSDGSDRDILLDNSTGASFTVIGSRSTAAEQIHADNPSIDPEILGLVTVNGQFPAPSVENIGPTTQWDYPLTLMNYPRAVDVVENDVDDGSKLLIYVSPLGSQGGLFSINDNTTPSQMDDLVLYQPQQDYQEWDFTYYVMQDAKGWMRLGMVKTRIVKNAVYLPLARK